MARREFVVFVMLRLGTSFCFLALCGLVLHMVTEYPREFVPWCLVAMLIGMSPIMGSVALRG